RRALIEALARRGIAARGKSGFNVWIPVAEEATTVAALADRGWAVRAGEPFRLRTPPAVRVTVSTLKLAEAERFAADLAACLHPATAASPTRWGGEPRLGASAASVFHASTGSGAKAWYIGVVRPASTNSAIRSRQCASLPTSVIASIISSVKAAS